MLIRRRNFYTGLIAYTFELRELPRNLNGRGWDLSFRKTANTKMFPQGRELVITAPSWLKAQSLLNLIRAAHLVDSGEPILLGRDDDLIAHNKRDPKFLHDTFPGLAGTTMMTSGIGRACLLAIKASTRRNLQYALVKFRLSAKLYSTFMENLRPFSSDHLRLSAFFDDHIAFSYAITLAYSAIEDLGLELRASSQKPSRINGKWNPVVKQDLEKRLSVAGVSLNQPIVWTIRGTKTKIQTVREVQRVNKARWAKGPYIRDSDVAIVDAIAYADWIRDRVATHAAKGLTPSLSPYDVVNVQHLARRLIMEVLGFWNHPTKNVLKDRP